MMIAPAVSFRDEARQDAGDTATSPDAVDFALFHETDR